MTSNPVPTFLVGAKNYKGGEKMEEASKMTLSLKIYELKGILFDEKGFTFNLHKDHPDAPLSPNYVDLRNIFRLPKMRKMIAEFFAPRIMQIYPDLLVDLPECATPLVTTLSDITGIDMISIRSEELKGGAKDHGVKRPINGFFEPGQTALIIDDVVSSFAFTKFRAIPILRDAGLNLVPTVYVVIDREEGGAEKLQEQGFELDSLLGLHSDVTKHCIEAGLASEKIREMSIKFAEAAKRYSLLQP